MEAVHRSDRTGRASMPIARWICLFALLLSEILILTFRFDTASLEKSNARWIALVRDAPFVPHLLLTIFTAAALIAGTAILNYLGKHADLLVKRQAIWLQLCPHLFCFGVLYRISAYLFEEKANALNSNFWPVAWIGAVLAVAFSWARMVAPGAVYFQLVRKHPKLILASVGLGLLGWIVGVYTNLLFRPLGVATFWLSSQLLSLVTTDTVANWNSRELGTSRFSVSIASQCSGYEGIGLILIFLGAYLWVSRDSLRFPRAFLLLPVGALTVWFMNGVRLASLILVGTYISEAIAIGGFHSMAGSLLFCCVALTFAWAAHRNRWIKKCEAKKSDRNSMLTEAYLVPFLALLAANMITGLITAGFDYFYPFRFLVVSATLWHYRRYYEGMRFEVSWFAIAAGTATFLVWVALAPTPGRGSAAVFANGLKTLSPVPAAIWLLCRVSGASVVIPLAEEIAFRGYLTRRMISANFASIPIGQFSWISFILSSAIFGFLHQRWFVGTLAGMVYALILYRRRNLADAVVAHATTNLALSAYILYSRQWSLWT
jgi:exosortase E/protease (VPEID-CTERM system)